MSWQEKDKVTLRREFLSFAHKPEINFTQLCKQYNISRKTGYKWLKRYQAGGMSELKDKSTRPHSSPIQLPSSVVEQICQIREKYPYWGARKIQAILARTVMEYVPAKSVIHKILQKNGYIAARQRTSSAMQRFEHSAPNHLWQMDFKGHFAYEKGRCHPLTILDDHSRFSLKLKACTNEKGETVKAALIEVFHQYGLPQRINVDNGNPWGSVFACARYTTFSLWLIRLGITVSYSRPGHPQTNGKDERFHRTLKLELLNHTYFKDLKHIQIKFDEWRNHYNCERPHEGIGMAVPVQRYLPSYRLYPAELSEVAYAPDYILRKVDLRGRISFEGRQIFVGIPFAKEILGVRYKINEEVIEIYYCHQKLGELDLQYVPKKTITNLYSGRVAELS